MGGGFCQIKTAQGNKGQCIERTGTGAKEAIVKPIPPPAINAKGKADKRRC